MKTPLPEKLGPNPDTIVLAIQERHAINQLIDCVAELRKEREEVEQMTGVPDVFMGIPNKTPPPVTTIEEMKKRAKKKWEELVSFCRKRKDGPSVFMHDSFIDDVITETYQLAQDQRTAEIRDMLEGLQKEPNYQLGGGYKEDEAFNEAISKAQALLTSLGNKSV